MRFYAFPFESIRKDSCVIIYGAGRVGLEYLDAVRKTGYCKIVCVLDRSADTLCHFIDKIYPPEHIRDISNDAYDIIIVANSQATTCKKIAESLANMGVSERKIHADPPALLTKTTVDNASLCLPDDNKDFFRLGIKTANGLGDNIALLCVINAIRKIAPKNLMIDQIAEKQATPSQSFIDAHVHPAAVCEHDGYDAILWLSQFTYLDLLKPEKARRIVPKLAEYFQDVIWFMETKFAAPSIAQYFSVNTFLTQTNCSMLEQNNVRGTLPIYRNAPIPLQFDHRAYNVLERFRLQEGSYITLSIDSNSLFGTNNKQWHLSNYSELIRLLKERFPRYLIVLVGAHKNSDASLNIDVDASGSTTIDELCVLLKYSVIHFCTEGGTTHIAHAVHSKSCCLYGSTNPKFFCYAENINIRSETPEICRQGCYAQLTVGGNIHTCLIDNENPPCMASITPYCVLSHVSNYLDSYEPPKYGQVEKIQRDKLQTLLEKKKCVLISRSQDTDVLNGIDKMISLTVFDTDLSEEPYVNEAPINLNYATRLKSLGADAEYATPYNITSDSNTFDIAICMDFHKREHNKYILLEMLRVVKTGGTVAVSAEKSEIALWVKQ